MSHSFTDALAAMAPELFAGFQGALEAYLGLASVFWRDAGELARELTAGRHALVAGLPDPAGPLQLRARLVEVLARWESVSGAWRELQAAGEVAMGEAVGEHREALGQHLTRLQQEFEQQASGLQVLVDLAALMDGLGKGSPGPVVPEA